MGRLKKEDNKLGVGINSEIQEIEEIEELELIKGETTEKENKEENKIKALKTLENQLIKEYGDKYYPITKPRKLEPVNFINTGCFSLDKVLGGGLPEGRVVCVYGEPSVGKSLFALSCVKAFQSLNKTCAYIDVEHALNPDFMEVCGVNTNELAIIRGDTAEENLDILRKLVKSNSLDLVVLDSVASLSSEQMQEKSSAEFGMANEARLLSRVLKELVTYAEKNKCTILLINQTRLNLGGYVTNKVMPGGQAIKFYASIILKLTKKENIKEKGDIKGVLIEASTDKNKVYTPFKSATFNILFPHEENGEIVAGIDIINDTIEACVAKEILKKSGAWLSIEYLGEEIKVCGVEKMIETLREDNNLLEYLKAELYKNKFN